MNQNSKLPAVYDMALGIAKASSFPDNFFMSTMVDVCIEQIAFQWQ